MSDELRRISYIHTSSTHYYPNVQASALQQAECTELYEANGKIDPHQTLKELLDLPGEGDTLIVYRMDRSGRDEHGVVNLRQQLKAMSIALVTTEDAAAKGD
jgi:DNA invertase Pin-like site-specific DNA recombinase